MIDLNADLGEGAPDDEGLLDLVTTAHIACGLHAGDRDTMRRTVAAAARRHVAVGAHPSYDDREGFGRRRIVVEPAVLCEQVAAQVRALLSVAAEEGAVVTSVKAHGALYNTMGTDEATARAVATAVVGVDPSLVLVVPAGSSVLGAAAGFGLEMVAEAFCDRGYRPDGTLVGRDEPGALLIDPADVGARALELARTGTVRANDGTLLHLGARTLCLHGDTPGALDHARRVRAALEAAGIALAPFAAPVGR